MSIWFLTSDPGRLTIERNAIAKLEQEADWLDGINWNLVGGELAVDATIRAHGHTYHVRMTYPAHFPYAPPIVQPADPDTRWSSHQYRDGTLCLEWGPDTWVSNVTGAAVLESAHSLFEIENPQGTDTLPPAPSRHLLTVGQELRGEHKCVHIPESLSEYLASLPPLAVGTTKSSYLFQRDWHTTIVFHEIRPTDAALWSNSEIPVAIRTDSFCQTGLLFNCLAAPNLQWLSKLDDLEAVLRDTGIDLPGPLSDPDVVKTFGLQKRPDTILVTDSSGQAHVFSLYGTDPVRLSRAPIITEPENATQPRAPVELQVLHGKKIAVIGLGSLGSKAALSLARMGARRFLLVDDDILLPHNLPRHALDWQSVGDHKVSAVAYAIEHLHPDADIQVSKVNLTGQENPATLSGVLKRIGSADLILDMTASPQILNLLTGVAEESEKPLVWAEVFAGGIGGLVARSRPALDPTPQMIRRAFLQFAHENPFPGAGIDLPYALDQGEGPVVIASDADVSIIAAHAAQMAADILVEREPSRFPHSLYLIGFARDWVFEQPFHTMPISTEELPRRDAADSEAQETPAIEMTDDNIEFVKQLLEKHRGKDSTPKEHRDPNG